MNLAFGALIITLLVIPGAIFITLYRSGSQDIPSVGASFQENLALYLITAIPIHGGLTFMYFFLRLVLSLLNVSLPVIRYDLAAKLLGGGRLDQATQAMFVHYSWYMLSYVLASFFLAAFLAVGARQLVRDYFLDLIYPAIRPNSAWHYFFTGEQQAIRRVAQEDTFRRKFRRAVIEIYKLSKTEFAYVSLAIEHGGVAYLYWGVLFDYRVRGDNLIQVTLTRVQRRPLSEDDPEANTSPSRPLPNASERFYPIRGAYIAFDASEVKSINVEFYRRLP